MLIYYRCVFSIIIDILKVRRYFHFIKVEILLSRAKRSKKIWVVFIRVGIENNEKLYIQNQQNHVLEIFSYLSLVVAVANSKIWHRPQDGHKGLNSVAIHYRSVLFEVFACKSTFVDNSETEKKTSINVRKSFSNYY